MRKLKILTLNDRYQTKFMTPRSSRHTIRRAAFIPFNLLDARLDGVTIIASPDAADLVHAHNRIPIGRQKFLMSFEADLPRASGFQYEGRYYRFMTRLIESPRCRRIVAMSHFAKRVFLKQHE